MAVEFSNDVDRSALLFQVRAALAASASQRNHFLTLLQAAARMKIFAI